jgi:hypothetical protein
MARVKIEKWSEEAIESITNENVIDPETNGNQA